MDAFVNTQLPLYRENPRKTNTPGPKRVKFQVNIHPLVLGEICVKERWALKALYGTTTAITATTAAAVVVVATTAASTTTTTTSAAATAVAAAI